MNEKNAYILGTDTEELHRLGIQHRVWASEAQQGWTLAGFTSGQTLLDLGCGPGFCTQELAYITGASGKVIGVDRSRKFITHLKRTAKLHRLNIDAIESDFDALSLKKNSLDGMYCRWALAWLSAPKKVLKKVASALKPGGTMVIHEYYDWSTHQTEPADERLDKGIAMALKSFKESEGEIDIGRYLPGMLHDLGLEVTHIRLMSKVGRPDNPIWQWPRTFYYSYFPRLVKLGYLTEKEMKACFLGLEELEKNPLSTLCCPLMVEVIARKPG